MIAHIFYTRISTQLIQRIAIRFLCICVTSFCASLFSIPSIAQVAETFPGWTKGHLDIHHINTGKGDAAFLYCRMVPPCLSTRAHQTEPNPGYRIPNLTAATHPESG
jgi:hypothetical protein